MTNLTKSDQALRQITQGRCVRNPEQYTHIQIEDVISYLKYGKHPDLSLSEAINKIRTEPNPEIACNLKQGLPFFTGSYYEGRRKNSNVQYALYAIIDLDHVQDIMGVKKQVMDNLTFALCAFQSVNDGVKIIIKLDPPIISEARYRYGYKLLKEKVNEITGLIPDSTPDWARACFYSYDPELLYKAECVGFICPDPPLPEPANPHQNVYASRPPFAPVSRPADDYEGVRSVILALSRRVINYNDWIKLGLALKFAFGDRGKELWDLFADNPHYQDSLAELDYKWRSFKPTGEVGIASIFYLGEHYGIC